MPELKEFIYVLRPTRPAMLTSGPTDSGKAVVGEHFQYLKGLCDRGVVVTAGRTTTADEKVFGICVFKAQDEAAAEALMKSDPAVAKRVMSAELFPFRIAMLTEVRT